MGKNKHVVNSEERCMRVHEILQNSTSCKILVGHDVACENNRFSSLFAAGDVSRETSPAAKSEEKRLFSQASHDE